MITTTAPAENDCDRATAGMPQCVHGSARFLEPLFSTLLPGIWGCPLRRRSKETQIRRTTDVARERERRESLRVSLSFCQRKMTVGGSNGKESLEPFQVVNDALETT